MGTRPLGWGALFLPKRDSGTHPPHPHHVGGIDFTSSTCPQCRSLTNKKLK